MDRELGFDFYTMKLLFIVAMTVTVCSCTVLAALNFYEIMHHVIFSDIPRWQENVLWLSFLYFGLYFGMLLIGRSGLAAILKTVDRAANGEANVFAKMLVNDFQTMDFDKSE